MNNPKVIIILIVVVAVIITLLFARCTVVRSLFDGVELVHQFNTDINQAKTPEGFVVIPQEIRKITPLTKYGWNIYADKENYYLSKGIQRMFTKTGDNSCLAKKNGIKISGTKRGEYDSVIEYMKSANKNRISSAELSNVLGQQIIKD